MPAIKLSCYGCRALNLELCDLGYSIKMVLEKGGLRHKPIPVNGKCPKPRTYDELESC